MIKNLFKETAIIGLIAKILPY